LIKYVRMLSIQLDFRILVLKIILMSIKELKINNLIGYRLLNFKNLLIRQKVYRCLIGGVGGKIVSKGS
jgi:hypothetical protein